MGSKASSLVPGGREAGAALSVVGGLVVPLALGGSEMGGNPSVSQVGAAKWVEPTPSYFLLSNQGLSRPSAGILVGWGGRG